MDGLKTKRVVWTVIFLGVTLVAIVMEVTAGLFHPAGTIPWTEYLARYVPWPVQLAAYVVLAVWLPFHFWRHDHLRKVNYRNGYMDAALALKLEHAEALQDAHDQGYLAALKDNNIPIKQGIDLLPKVSVRRGGIQYKSRDGR